MRLNLRMLFLTAGCIGILAAMLAFTERRQPIEILIPLAAGTQTHAVMLRIQDKFSQELDERVVLINDADTSGGENGTASFVRNTSSVRKLIVMPTGLLFTPLMKKASYTYEDFVPVSLVSDFCYVVVVQKRIGISSLSDLVNYRPHEHMIVTGIGSTVQVLTELLAKKRGVKTEFLPSKNPFDIIRDMNKEDVRVFFGVYSYFLGGNLELADAKVIAVLNKDRCPLLPDVPTALEQGFPEFASVPIHIAMFAKQGTSPEFVERAAVALQKALNDPEVRAWGEPQGTMPQGSSPDTLRALMENWRKTWGGLIKELGIRLTLK